ncbi:trihelix transcription factor PTL-like [Cynara cardunculus var. scolymus]|uniref:trihelix transcription factor PTL-like n=1 Tax=Cynara cardunculus var. scolymus TaxID=59895 RepID=UPI000D627EFC|nr:trihelix transcription factor PTL-like [Cynara cardunculus var. scolymus]
MEEQYGIANLAHYMNISPIFTAITQPPCGPHHDLHYEMVVVGSGGGGRTIPPGPGSRIGGLSVGDGGLEMGIGGGDVNGRWPRQETLTLLEVRSRMNCKFKEANHKGPLWNEVSRIMSEEHGYQRNAKKCREKFENLYKYYKRTKEGKAGRQDGKHYRFFSQLEALYGERGRTTCPNPNCKHAMGSFTENTDCVGRKMKTRKLRKRSWKNIEDFIDAQTRKIMDKQEAWMEKMMKTIEQKEQERMSRVEQWRKEDVGRLEIKHKFWGKRRAWMESREPLLMQALHKLTEKKSLQNHCFPECNDYINNPMCKWGENEIRQLIHFRRTNIDAGIEQVGNMEGILWDEIASKMASLGYNRNKSICKTKWDSINELEERSKRRKESTRSTNFQYQEGTFQEHERPVEPSDHQNDGCYRLLMGDQEDV